MNFETTARPYAQAIYDHSKGWEKDLGQLELALETPEVQHLIDSPKLAYKEKTKIFLSLFEGQIESKTSNFVRVLGESKRISLIPYILAEYINKDKILSIYEFTGLQANEVIASTSGHLFL